MNQLFARIGESIDLFWHQVSVDVSVFFRTHVRTWWWIIRYGGKKNIPKEVVFKAMAASVQRMEDNLRKARDVADLREMTEKERMNLRKARIKAAELSMAIKDLEKKASPPRQPDNI